MYKVKTGVYSAPCTAEFDDITKAMDLAEELYSAGFNYVSVVDEQNKTQYSIGVNEPMTPAVRQARNREGAKYMRARGL